MGAGINKDEISTSSKGLSSINGDPDMTMTKMNLQFGFRAENAFN